MRTVSMVCIGTFVFFLGCSTGNEAHDEVSVTLVNKSGGTITDISVCIENTAHCRQIPELAAKDTTLNAFSLPPVDGGFVYTSQGKNGKYTRRFGYFTNGSAMTGEYRIEIHSPDSASVSE